MKRKKWSESEEQTLLSKYANLLNSGTLSKLKTREKKFKPIADHVNSLHHLQDPISFPFKWCWRDVSIKVQNMRHQYLGVKQKIRINSSNEFNWADGNIHWENFLKYKEVFGDIELMPDFGCKDKENNVIVDGKKFGEKYISDIFGYEMDSEEVEDEEEVEDDEDEGDGGDLGISDEADERTTDGKHDSDKGFKGKSLRMVGAEVLMLKDMIYRREEKRKDREGCREEMIMEKEAAMKEQEISRETLLKEREDVIYRRDMELEKTQMKWAKGKMESRMWLEREFDEERRRRMKWEERWEEEEIKWREMMLEMQMEHEKQIMQIHADACQNQLQILGVLGRLVCQYFGPTSDGLGTIPPHVLQNMQHQGSLADNGKPDSTLPSDFL